MTGLRCLTRHAGIKNQRYIGALLQTNEGLSQLLIDALPLCISYVDAEQRYRLVNRTYETWFGFGQTEIQGKLLQEVIGEMAYASVRPYVEQALAGQPVQYESEVCYQRLGRRFISAMLVPDFGDRLQVQGYYAVITDITERKQIEIALRRSEERFSKVFRANPIGSSISTFPEGRLLDVNETWCQMFGYQRNEVLGHTVVEMGIGRFVVDRATILQQLEQFGTVTDLEVQFQTQAGEVREGLVCLEVIEVNGERCVLTTILDITRLKQAEFALKQSEERFRSIFENVSVGIALVDRAGHVLAANEADCRFLGYSRQELIGMHFSEFTYPDDLETDANLYASLIAGQISSYTIDKRYIRKDSAIVWACITVSLIRAEDGTIQYTVVVCEDINDRKRAETVLWQQAERERLLRVITQRIRQSLDLDQILATAVLEVCQTLQADRAVILRLNLDGSAVVIEESVTPGYPSIIDRVWMDERFLKVCCEQYRQGQPHIVPDLMADDWAACMAEFMQSVGVKSKVVAPIIQTMADSSSRVWGLLIVHACSHHRRWQPDEADLLQQISHQLAIAIHQAAQHQRLQLELTERQRAERALQRALAREQQAIERERFMAAIAQRVRESLDLNQILTTTVEEVRTLLHVDRVVLLRLQPQGEATIASEAVSPEYQPMLGASVKTPWLQHLETNDWCQGTHSISNIQADPLLSVSTFEYLMHYQVQAMLTVPMLQNGRVLSVLAAHQCSAPRDWQEYEISLLEQLATQVAIAIHQSELYQQMQQLNLNLEEQVQERTTQLQQAFDCEATLKRITDRVRDSLDEAQILQSAVEELAIVIGVNTCNAGLYDLERQVSTICYEYTTGDAPSHRGLVVPMENVPQGYRQLLAGQYFQFCSNELNPTGGQTAILACPIFDDQGSLGDLWLIHARSYEFCGQDVRLVQQVANQCAIAIRQSRLFQATQAQVEELEQLNRLKDSFLSTISHELRTPMSSIKMATQMLEIILFNQDQNERPSQLTQQILNQSTQLAVSPISQTASFHRLSRYFQILKDECQREISLINDLLDLTGLDTDNEPLSLAILSPSVWILRALEPFVARVNHQQQQLTLNIPSDLPPIVTDLGYLERIITELLTNACKYTPPGERIAIAAWVNATGLELQVSNSGVDIPVAERDRIFEKFYRIPHSDPWRHSGTGLGLALVKKLVERLNATIRVESGDRETHFILHFPALELPSHPTVE
ncbi:PAS domain S-box protein [Oculatella sp. LEGE 06141]|uniref:PAS domain S-box protein n=1 Tax=Oculatella sp. LEGE 06141 TaxID=1828648 RepID=UPI0018803C04|nr:PAS domain S-box protein [Oculatella sp. LEGE 06141]MBE9180574.1 PAS domain S-box protein [Oculatella sp. LEGE 06141]